MKKLLSLLIICCILSSSFLLPSSAESSKFEELWEQKMAYEDGWYGDSLYFVYMGGVGILLYTDLLSDIHFEYEVWEFRDNPEEEDNLPPPLAPLFGSYNELDEDEDSFWYSPEFEKALDPYRAYEESRIGPGIRVTIPVLKILVDYFNISKEELYAAREKMKNDPYSIREQLPEEVFQSWDPREGAEHAYDDFIIEALYLDDPIETEQLLVKNYALLTNFGPITMDDDEYVGKRNWEEVIVYAPKEHLDRFVNYHRERLISIYGEEQAEEMLSMKILSHLEQNFYNPPPKAGDSTAAYALIFTLSAMPLAGLCVYGWKKRRRMM